jgi:beta-glucanase (GH16 family)
VGYLDTTENNSYGISSLLLESAIMSPGTNSLVFTQSSPGWIWGIENILIEPSPTIALPLNTLNAQKYGHAFEGTSNFQESVEFVFPGSANNLLLSLDTYDIDFVDEVAIQLNGNLIGYLNTTDNNAYGESSIIIPAALSLPGDNSLVFEQKNSGWRWGVTNILLSTQAANQPILNNYELVFADEFNGSELDASKWNTGMLWGPYLQINHEKQLYVDTLGINQGFEYSPFELTGNSLKITAVPTTAALAPPTRPAETDPIWDNFAEYRFNGPSDAGPGYSPDDIDYLSGIINSYDSFKMTHGYVEARVKLPVGKGLWPAFWLLNTHYVGDAPEIDVMEFLGDNPSTVYHTYHYFDINNNWSKISTPSFTSTAQDWTHSFHTFGLAWSPNELVWYIDGVETRRITNSDYKISAQAMYLILNLAVGGQWPGDPDATTPFPATFEIDYIRAYKKKLSPDLDLAADYQLMFNDEFDGNSLDTSKWNTAFLWGPYYAINNEEQYYVDSNGVDADKSYSPFTVANGELTITADLSSNSGTDVPPAALPSPNDPVWIDHPEFQQGPYAEAPKYTSGIITSYDAFKFVNGYAEIRAKVPSGDGLWPAFWLLNAYYVGSLPEIDVMEILGEDPTRAYHTFHRSDVDGSPVSDQYTSESTTPIAGYSDGFHTYGVRWQPGKITWYVDGQVVDTFEETDPTKNDAYQLMYVIANLAVGGQFNTLPVDDSAIPAEFVIDYIRVYQENDTP